MGRFYSDHVRRDDRILSLAADVIEENEAEMASLIGDASFARLKGDLKKIVDEVDPIGF